MDNKQDIEIIETFENDIDMYLHMFAEENGIDDLKNATQSQWNAALMYTRRHAFNDPSVLKDHTPLKGYVNNNYSPDTGYNNLNLNTCGRYNMDLINKICDYYIYVCYVYNKSISIMGFSRLTGIDQATIHQWGHNVNKLSTPTDKIFQKLSTEREESWVAKLENMNHPTAIAILLNKHYAYNLPGVSREQTNKRVLTASELPKLGRENENETHE